MQRSVAGQVVGVAAGLAVAFAVGCTDGRSSFGAEGPEPALAQTYPAPAGLVTAAGFEFLPYTLNHYLAGNQDPINLIFTGNVDPLQLRAALLAVTAPGSPAPPRQALGIPSGFPFDCAWRDALGGDEQVAYGNGAWTGSVIQLACGDYSPVRFHLRLFPAGNRTLANAHFEFHIPGTADHQVLNWELAEQLVLVDMVRSGMVAYPEGISGAAINQLEYFKEIPLALWNVPEFAPLQPLATYPYSAPVNGAEGGIGIPTDGSASVLDVTGAMSLTPMVDEQHITLEYNFAPAPKPICNANGDKYIYIAGPVDLWQTDVLTASGEYSRTFKASGYLQVTPVNPMTLEPIGATQEAIVNQEQLAKFWPGMASTSRRFTQTLVPVASDEGGRASMFLQWGPNGKTKFDASETCGS